MTEIRMIKTGARLQQSVNSVLFWSLINSDLGFVSDFGIRASDF